MTDHTQTLDEVLQETVETIRNFQVSVSTAESCTGGGVAQALTSLPGSSSFMMGGVVSYQDYVKEEVLGVGSATIERYGVVSRETVIEMAKGASRLLKTHAAVSTSGIAGPSGAEPGKPVGTIWMAAVSGDVCLTYMQSGDNGRADNISRAIKNALKLLEKAVKEEKRNDNEELRTEKFVCQ